VARGDAGERRDGPADLAAGGAQPPVTRDHLTTYLVLVSLTTVLTSSWTARFLAESIRSGRLNAWLVRAVDRFRQLGTVFLPGAWGPFLQAQPFGYVVAFPIRTLLEPDAADLGTGFAPQAAWVVVALAVARVLGRPGVPRLLGRVRRTGQPRARRPDRVVLPHRVRLAAWARAVRQRERLVSPAG
jgi:ABC-type uncharacterized transport system permease subunit